MTTPEEFRAAVRQAEILGLDLGEQVAEGDLTRSELERRFLHLCRRHRIPTPEVNVRLGPFLVDFLWRDERLVVETDGYRFHRGRLAFEADRARDVELRLRGYEVVRFTHRQVVDESLRIARTIRTLLRERGRVCSRYPRGERPAWRLTSSVAARGPRMDGCPRRRRSRRGPRRPP